MTPKYPPSNKATPGTSRFHTPLESGRLPRVATPGWLLNITPDSNFPLEHILKRSVYYPASGIDGRPIRFMGFHVQSFVYVDYGNSSDEVLAHLQEPKFGFRGYNALFCRTVSEGELFPGGFQLNSIRRAKIIQAISRPMRAPYPSLFSFAIWAVFDRQAEFTDEHGPQRFSVLYIGGEGVAMHHELYVARQKSPEVIAIVQPGTGFGGNWTNFTSEEAELYKAFTIVRNRPTFLLQGGWCSGDHLWADPMWGAYSDQVCRWRVGRGELGLWKLGSLCTYVSFS